MEQDNNQLFNHEGYDGPMRHPKRTTKSDSWFFMGNEITDTQASLLLTSPTTSILTSSEMSPLPNWSLEEMANIVLQLAEKRKNSPNTRASSRQVILPKDPVNYLLNLLLPKERKKAVPKPVRLTEKRKNSSSLSASSLGVIPEDPPVKPPLDLLLSKEVVPKTVQPSNDLDVSAIINSINSSMAANIKKSTPCKLTCRKCCAHGKISVANVHHRFSCPYKSCFCTGCEKVERIRNHDRAYKKDLKQNRYQG